MLTPCTPSLSAEATAWVPPLPEGEVDAKRRVRGYALSIDLNPSPEFLACAQNSTSPDGRGEKTLLRLRRGHRAHRIAFAQQRAGAGDHHVALGQAVADFDLARRHQPDLD